MFTIKNFNWTKLGLIRKFRPKRVSSNRPQVDETSLKKAKKQPKFVRDRMLRVDLAGEIGQVAMSQSAK
jgi:hypothetical protein